MRSKHAPTTPAESIDQLRIALEEALEDFEICFDPERDDEPGWVILARQTLVDTAP